MTAIRRPGQGGVWSRAIRAVDDLPLRRKLQIAYVLFLLPISFLFYVLYARADADIDRLRREIVGVGVIKQLRVVQDAFADPGIGLVSRVLQAAGSAEAPFAGSGEIRQKTAALRDAIAAGSPAAVAETASALIAAVADVSGLTLDTELASFRVQDLVSTHIPGIVENIAAISGIVAAHAGALALSPDTQAEGLLAEGKLRFSLDRLNAAVAAIPAGGGPDLKRAGEAAAANVRAAMIALDRAVREPAGMERETIAAATRPALVTLASLGQEAAAELDRMLRARIGALQGHLLGQLVVALVLFGFAVLFVAFVERRVVAPLARLTDVLHRLAGGQTDVEISGSPRGDEIGDIVRGTQAFKQSLTLARALEADNRRVLAELTESEQRIRTIVDNMPIGIFVKVGNRYPLANKTVADWLGIPHAKLERMTDRELYAAIGWTAEQQESFRSQLARQRDPAGLGTVEVRAQLAGGRTGDLIVSRFPLAGSTDDAQAVGVAITDITDLRRAQAHLTEARKMDALGRLAGGVAHDFNNIIGAIAGYARFIFQDAPADSSTRRYAERIMTGSQRAKELVRQILAFSQHTEIKRQRISMLAAVAETADLLRASMPPATQLVVAGGPRDAIVEADTAQIMQVLMNICVNANDALMGRPGQIELSVSLCSGADAAGEIGTDAGLPADTVRRVAGRIDPSLAYVAVRARDTGCGMPSHVMERMFEPFFTTKPSGKGTGLGLAVVHGIVLNHGGALAVASRAGGGTTVQLWLPRAADGDDAAALAGFVAPAPGHGRILVVDDDDAFGDMVATAMERQGYEVAVMNQPREAVAVFAEDPAAWDVLITDQTMPGMTGLELIAACRKRRPELPCVLCTGYSFQLTEAMAMENGVSAFLPKPVDPLELEHTVARLLATRAAGAPA